MKRLASLVVGLSVLASVALAGDPKPITGSGSKALLFDLGGLAFLATGDYAGGLGAKYYVSNDLAVRLSFGFSTSTTTSKNTVTPLPAGQLAESKLTSNEFSVQPAIIYHVAKLSTVTAYVGGMLSFSTAKDKREGNSAGLAVDYDSGESYRESSSSWGVAGILGVEWFPWENISFSGEYRLGFNRSSSETESTTAATSVTVEGPTSSGFGLGSANAGAVTLSVYF